MVRYCSLYLRGPWVTYLLFKVCACINTVYEHALNMSQSELYPIDVRLPTYRSEMDVLRSLCFQANLTTLVADQYLTTAKSSKPLKS